MRKNVVKEQVAIPFLSSNQNYLDYKEKFEKILRGDLSFHSKRNRSDTHALHSFPAKFPPQLPKVFIDNLTNPGDVVLDPMAGSGTTVLEAFHLHRKAIGFDVDPIALLISKVKLMSLPKEKLRASYYTIVEESQHQIRTNTAELEKEFIEAYDEASRKFIDYWFLPQTRLELYALIRELKKIDDQDERMFFKLIFSSLIITKSGGVSLALDLAHTRPHRAKLVLDKSGDTLLGGLETLQQKRASYITKRMRSVFEEFERRFTFAIENLGDYDPTRPEPIVEQGDSQALNLPNNSIDLIVTSPPYASNAIDYMRAHKFSLVWFGYPASMLTERRKEYIGGESTTNFNFEDLPDFTLARINQLGATSANRAKVLGRYYSEMKRVLLEMFRVLRANRGAVLVVGNSILKGVDTKTPECIAEIAVDIGFTVVHTGIRHLDRNRRMLPAGHTTNRSSQIEKRMHEEYVVGLFKPDFSGEK